MNIKFYYVYRDFSNYKKHNEIIFRNSANKPVDDIRDVIKQHLIDGEWFYSSEWKVPDLHFENWDSEDDHFLHEFGWVEETNEASTNNVEVEDFLATIRTANSHF